MHVIGYVLIGVGFLVGALASVWQVEGILVNLYAVGGAMGMVGVIMARLGTRRLHRSEARMSANLDIVKSSLNALIQAVDDLDEQKTDLSVYEIHHLIDDRTVEAIESFVEARESIAHAHGLQAYADLMSHFASGERALNRAWSASTDGYIDEVHESLSRARQELQAAGQLLSAVA
ncbi:MAG: hypothetical protein KDC35_11615 [Acidobacteria bacterium]|nr:hypothetical protein [Acidobacteriota bacterium]